MSSHDRVGEKALAALIVAFIAIVHYTKAVSFIHRLSSLDLWTWDWSMFAGYRTEYTARRRRST